MSTLSVYEESDLSKSLSQFWRRVLRKFNRDRIPDAIEQDVDLTLSWKHFTNNDECNVFTNENFDEVLFPAPVFSTAQSYLEVDSDLEDKKSEEITLQSESNVKTSTDYVVDGASIGDIPATYTLKGLFTHELPVIGTFVHPRIVIGFSYTVRSLDNYLPFFNGEAVCLQRIGMGYGKRLTFGGDSLHENNNYFWSDSCPEGYGFTLVLVHRGDRFTVLNINNQPIALVEVAHVMGNQRETEESIKSTNYLEKQCYVTLQCNIHYFEDNHTDHIILSGVAIAVKDAKSRSPASIIRIRDCYINGDIFTLVPTAVDVIQRSKSVSGESVGDVPASYFISGLLPNELPVIGTFIDSKIIPGFKYRVRVVDTNQRLFGGKALTLISIGRGYGKRLTFESKSLKENENYFWSDTNPAGYGFTLEAVSEKYSFVISNETGDEIGKASVFKVCGPQLEYDSFFTKEQNIFTKKVKVCIACHLTLNGSSNEITTRVEGIAYVERKGHKSVVQRITDLTFPCLFKQENITEDFVFVKYL